MSGPISRIAQAVSEGKLSPTQTVTSALQNIESSNPTLNYMAQHCAESALEAAASHSTVGVLAGVPTWKEQGVNATYTSVQGILAPPGMTQEQILFWERAIAAVTESEEWNKFLETQYWQPRFMKSAEMKKYLEREYEATKLLIDEFKLSKK